ncbi:MAG: ATP-binding cassette domain-containing protein [Phycisphaera sp.]|nr:ATP-binding cassette domain-containing protein [Phycisphaera sp.]
MPQAVAEFDRVSKVYVKMRGAPPVHALREVSMTVPRGQYLAIMGPSGSGKSTMMNIVGCLDRPSTGRYLLDGHDVSQMTDSQISQIRGRGVGFVFQAFNLIPQLTVAQNVEVPLFYQSVPAHERHGRAVKAIERVGLSERLHHRPAQLSGGQQQRVAIARALVNEPSLLLADEPTGNLDSATGTAVLDLFDELHAQGLTIVMVTHDDEVATRCQRVVRLRDGAIESDVMTTHAGV